MIFSAHLIDDDDEIRERFVAHGRIRPMWSKRQESAIEPAVDRPVDHAPTRDGLRRRAGPRAVPEFIKILEAGSGGGEVTFIDQGLIGATAVLKLERFIVDGRGASATNPPATLVATKGAAGALRNCVSRMIDLRTDIVILLADATPLGGGSVARAAERLHLSQPATSHALSRLSEANSTS